MTFTLYIVRFLHQTTTLAVLGLTTKWLYIVRFLHQTTTTARCHPSLRMLYIVRFLHQTTTLMAFEYFCCWLYIVRFLHQTTTDGRGVTHTLCCISFVSYIKPQPRYIILLLVFCCISFVSYIKPQPSIRPDALIRCCISFVSYIKPQLQLKVIDQTIVVYRSFPTSNHNEHPTATTITKLYIVRFLHQTTTAFQ